MLVSVGVVAVVAFLLTLRTVKGSREAPRQLDGNPRWISGRVAKVQGTSEYLGAPVATLTIELEGKSYSVRGPLPRRYADQIGEGFVVEGHVEYDALDTLRSPLWDASPAAVLSECAELLGVAAAPDRDPCELAFTHAGREVTVFLATDGWLTVMVLPRIDTEISVDLRAEHLDGAQSVMLRERLHAAPADSREVREFLDQLTDETLARLEAFVACVEGWICIDPEAFEFECALAFPDAELVTAFVEEAVTAIDLIERDTRGVPHQTDDGAW